jgi:hypothetical protein
VLRNRRFRRTVCRLAAGAVLLAQIAVSAYACPGLNAPPAEPSTAALAHHCDAVDDDAAAVTPLCSEHCRYGQQVDQSKLPIVAAPPTTYRYAVPTDVTPRRALRWSATAVPVALSPPHAILHCSLLI